MRVSVCVLGVLSLIAAASCQRSESLSSERASGTSQIAQTKGQGTVSQPQPQQTGGRASAEIFQKRILPIFQSSKPSSCAECHLSGVDLKDYVRPTQEETFAALAQAGLVNKAEPDKSKILVFIQREPEKATLVSKEVRRQEYEGFRDWIHAAVQDPQLLASKSDTAIGPQVPLEVIRHARTDRVLNSFIENVWSEVGRCAACHSPDRNDKQVREHGERVSWIKLNDPEATMKHMLEAGLIDLDAPAESLLLKKPLLQVKHGGGQKMVVGDRTYQQFRRFIDDYAAIETGSYRSATDLPKAPDEVSIVTEVWLKITEIPAKYDKMLLQADLHRWTGSGWSEQRVATSDRLVFGAKNLWQHSLSLTAPRDSEDARKLNERRLPAGRYLVRIYIDQGGKLQKDPRSRLGADDFVAEVEVESQWPAGYGQMTSVSFPSR